MSRIYLNIKAFIFFSIGFLLILYCFIGQASSCPDLKIQKQKGEIYKEKNINLHSSDEKKQKALKKPSIYVGKMKQFFPYWGRYLKLTPSKRDKFQYVFYAWNEDEIPTNTAKLWYCKGSERIYLEILKTGKITNMPDLEIYQKNLALFTDNAEQETRFQIHAFFEPVVQYKIITPGIQDIVKTDKNPSHAQKKYYQLSLIELREAYQQFNNVYQYILGLRGMFTPKLNWIAFAFNQSVPEAIAIDYKQEKTELHIQYDKAYFSLKNKKMKQYVTLRFGEIPERIWFET